MIFSKYPLFDSHRVQADIARGDGYEVQKLNINETLTAMGDEGSIRQHYIRSFLTKLVTPSDSCWYIYSPLSRCFMILPESEHRATDWVVVGHRVDVEGSDQWENQAILVYEVPLGEISESPILRDLLDKLTSRLDTIREVRQIAMEFEMVAMLRQLLPDTGSNPSKQLPGLSLSKGASRIRFGLEHMAVFMVTACITKTHQLHLVVSVEGLKPLGVGYMYRDDKVDIDKPSTYTFNVKQGNQSTLSSTLVVSFILSALQTELTKRIQYQVWSRAQSDESRSTLKLLRNLSKRIIQQMQSLIANAAILEQRLLLEYSTANLE